MLDINEENNAHVHSEAENAEDIVNSTTDMRFDWSTDEIEQILNSPLLELVYRAQTIHRKYHPDNTVQLASLLSIKTGGCPEDCKYCTQSAHHRKTTGVVKEPLMQVDEVLEKAQEAKDAGATRFCMGAAWRGVRDGEEFDRVVDMVKGVSNMGMEACVTLGMLNADQAKRLADAGLTSYNHNLDTSPEFYDKVITTRTYEDRLQTLEHVRNAGVTLCTGGIIGMGETLYDRASMLQVLSTMKPHPESVPINALVGTGTPLEGQKRVEPMEMVRMIATARVIMPKTTLRLSAGRHNLTKEAQILCFMAGANSIFYGDKLLTTQNSEEDDDIALIREAGLKVLGSTEGCGSEKCGCK